MFEQELGRVIEEWSGQVGAALTTVWQPARDRVVLGWKSGSMWLIVPRGPFARLHSVEERSESPPRPYSFQGACRARLAGRLGAIEKTPGEREVVLRFTSGTLVVRLSGRSGGLWLLDGDRVVASLDGPAPDALPPLPAHRPHPDAPRFAPVEGSWDRGARDWFTAREAEAARDRLRVRAEGAIRDRLRRERRLLEHLVGDLAGTAEAPEVRRRAALLAANLWRVQDGQTAVDVEDWDTGAHETLTWKPGDSASTTVAKWFDGARRLERAAIAIRERSAATERSVRRWEAALERLPRAPPDELERWITDGPPAKARSRPSAGVPSRTWTGPHGEELSIGTNEAGNRRLVFQVARGHDVWMHLRDRPSAHVVLRLEKGTSPSLPHLLAGAQVLLDRMGFSAGDVAEVQYAWIRDVRSVPGGGARVTVSNEKVLRVTSDREALAGWDTVA